MRIVVTASLLFCLSGCSDSLNDAQQQPPVPREIVDLGALITEDTPAQFWGKGFLAEMGFAEGNTFDVIQWSFGPVSGSNAYYRLFNHGGPHVDAPNHVGAGGGLDTYPVESFAGPAKVFDFHHLPIGRTITREMVEELPIVAGDIVLLYTGYSAPGADGSWPEAIALTYEAASYLAELPIRAIGTDAFNVESMTDETPINIEDERTKILPGHFAFLPRGIPLFEQLVNLDQLLGEQSLYFVGAPLNIKDSDGMMVRPLVLVY